MYAVIFKAKSNTLDNEYITMANRMRELAIEKYGCTDFISVSENDIELTISYWKSEEDIKEWKKDTEHIIAQELGQSKWYDSYTIQIAKVVREYSNSKKTKIIKQLSNIEKFEKVLKRRNNIINIKSEKIKNEIKDYFLDRSIKLITLVFISIITLILSSNNIDSLINLTKLKLNYAYGILIYTTMFATLAIWYTKKYNKQKNIYTNIIETSFNTGHVAISAIMGVAFYLLIFHKSKFSEDEPIFETFTLIFFIWFFYISYVYLIQKAFKR